MDNFIQLDRKVANILQIMICNFFAKCNNYKALSIHYCARSLNVLSCRLTTALTGAPAG
jgi:hypothetical protein